MTPREEKKRQYTMYTLCKFSQCEVDAAYICLVECNCSTFIVEVHACVLGGVVGTVYSVGIWLSDACVSCNSNYNSIITESFC